MRIKMAAIAAGVMVAAAGCGGGSAEKDAALQAAWDSFGTAALGGSPTAGGGR